MAVGYRNAAGVDFDLLFDPYVTGTPVGPIGARMNNTVDIGPRYAPISFGSKGPDVGLRLSNSVDVSNLWAAIGTASYANRGGVPDTVSDEIVTPPTGGTAFAFVAYRRNGTVEWSNGGPGTWAPGGGTPGDAYDIKYQNLGISGGGTLSGADNVWRQVNADRQCSLSIFASGGTSRITTASVNVQIRRRSDSALVVNYNLNLYASVTSDG